MAWGNSNLEAELLQSSQLQQQIAGSEFKSHGWQLIVTCASWPQKGGLEDGWTAIAILLLPLLS